MTNYAGNLWRGATRAPAGMRIAPCRAFAATTRVTLENAPSKVRATKISKTTPCKVEGRRKSNLTRRANQPHNCIIPKCCSALDSR
jgi:hypothetical protein